MEDRALIDSTSYHETNYWAKKFGITRGELILAIEEHGNKVAHLKQLYCVKDEEE